MRMLFYTAAAIAATIATVGQSIRLDAASSNDQRLQYLQENSFSQLDAFQVATGVASNL